MLVKLTIGDDKCAYELKTRKNRVQNKNAKIKEQIAQKAQNPNSSSDDVIGLQLHFSQ